MTPSTDDRRTCNLAIDWVQVCTAICRLAGAELPVPRGRCVFSDSAPRGLAGKTLTGPTRCTSVWRRRRHQPVHHRRAVRDIVCGDAENVLFVNGSFSGIEDPGYLNALLADWAGARRELDMTGEDIIATVLKAGDTDIILAYNYAGPERRAMKLQVPSPASRPVVEIRALSRDGVRGSRARSTVGDNVATVDEELEYYGVYEVTRGRVGLTTPELRLVPGEVVKVDVELDNRVAGARTGRVDGTIGIVPHLPSLTSDVVPFQVPAGGRQTVSLTLTAREDLDWGEKTVVFDVEVAGRHSYFWRTLTVQRLPRLAIRPGVIGPEAGE